MAGDVAKMPADIRGYQFEQTIGGRSKQFDVKLSVQENRGDVGAGQQISHVVVDRLQLQDLFLELAVDRGQFLIERLQFFLGGFQLFIGGLELLVHRHDFFVGDLQLLVGGLQLFDGALQIFAGGL